MRGVDGHIDQPWLMNNVAATYGECMGLTNMIESIACLLISSVCNLRLHVVQAT